MELEYYQGWFDTDSDSLKAGSGSLQLNDLADWLDSKGRYTLPRKDESKGGFRILSCPLARRGPFSLGLPKPEFEDVQAKFNLHESTSRAFLDNNGAFVRFLSTDLGSPRKLNHMRMVLSVPNCINIGYDGLSLSYCPENRTIMALYHGLQNWDRVLKLLKMKVHLCSHPMLIPMAFFYVHQEHLGRYRGIVDANVCKTEHEIGYAIPGLLDHVSRDGRNRRSAAQPIDYESIVKRLHSYQTELASVANVGRFSKDCGDFLLLTTQELEDYSPIKDDGEFHSNGEEITHNIQFSTSLGSTLLSQILALKERIQSQTNLIFSLISQDDNKISRSIAEQSAAIAVSSKRDSTAMKTIALLTIIFLPGTFVATFFSMSMFNWNPSEGSNPKVSPYIWIYWVVTIPLTVITFLVWRLWWKSEDSKNDYQNARVQQKHNPQKQSGSNSDGQQGVENYLHKFWGSIWGGMRRLIVSGNRSQLDEEHFAEGPKKE